MGASGGDDEGGELARALRVRGNYRRISRRLREHLRELLPGGEGLADDGDAEFLEWSGLGGSLGATAFGLGSEETRERSRRAKWEPEPVESEVAGEPRPSGAAKDDELGQLVSIYGSKELFIAEYRNMLAERLLGKVGHDVDRETHALELLKLAVWRDAAARARGDAEGHAGLQASERQHQGASRAWNARGDGCDGARAQTDALRASPLDATVVSALFWPPFADEAPDFSLPESMNALPGNVRRAVPPPGRRRAR